MDHEKIVIHDSRDMSQMVDLGVLPSGAPLLINRVAADVNEALQMDIAEKGHDAHIAVIPDGVSVMVH